MNITAEYFFDSDLALPELAGAINEALGCSLVLEGEDPAPIYRCWFFGASLRLEDNDIDGYENMGELNFEDFRYCLVNTTSSWARPILIEVLAETAFLLHHLLDIHAGILTYEMQVLLARYDLIDGEWFDTVCGKRIGFPGHLIDIKNRISDPQDRGLIYWPP